MFKVHRTGNHLDFTFGGRLEASEMKEVLDEFTAQAEGIENGTMLIRIEHFEMPSRQAIALEFARLPKMLGILRRFRRAAVVADETWIRRISQWESMLIPGLEIQSFPPGEETAASTWLTRP
ncbi:hypothetical protein HNR46_001265 [Haloferula luteola]|uniref:STAS/SEC14 domain-containing protein n=1 Tax=Haloferula luteola TaxID=595692 RepID=A0A840VDW6_9BACT|nr:STAS/SEC14 domain-containing protein [Haloferula luteola]MBB5351031.1 hypothetical protein [Haloferula luteola]